MYTLTSYVILNCSVNFVRNMVAKIYTDHYKNTCVIFSVFFFKYIFTCGTHTLQHTHKLTVDAYVVEIYKNV